MRPLASKVSKSVGWRRRNGGEAIGGDLCARRRWEEDALLVLCSRSARPQKGLARRPQWDHQGYPSRASGMLKKCAQWGTNHPCRPVLPRQKEVSVRGQVACRLGPVFLDCARHSCSGLEKSIGFSVHKLIIWTCRSTHQNSQALSKHYGLAFDSTGNSGLQVVRDRVCAVFAGSAQ